VRQLVTAFFAGLLFAIGLAAGGMTQPAKVIGFLDLLGDWDPSLVFVMGGAVAVHAILFRLVLRRSRPLLAPRFVVPTRRDLTPRLVGGAALFGVGWGLGGFCPGPGIVAAPSGAPEALVFVATMAAGMLLYEWVERLRARRTAAGERPAAPEPQVGRT